MSSRSVLWWNLPALASGMPGTRLGSSHYGRGENRRFAVPPAVRRNRRRRALLAGASLLALGAGFTLGLPARPAKGDTCYTLDSSSSATIFSACDGPLTITSDNAGTGTGSQISISAAITATGSNNAVLVSEDAKVARLFVGASVNAADQEAVHVSEGATVTTLENSGTITVGNPSSYAGVYNLGTITSIINNPGAQIISISSEGAIGTIDNQGTINGTIAVSGSVDTINNQGNIGQDYDLSGIIVWFGTVGTINNESSGTIYHGILISSTVTDLINRGTITNSGMSGFSESTIYDGIISVGTIANITNLGTIESTAGGGFGINNLGTIGTLSNAQHGLTYSGTLPATYRTYFTTSSDFGTIVFTTSDTSLSYGLAKADGVSYAVGTYEDVVSSDTALSFTTVTVDGVTYTVDLGSGCGSTYCYDLTISAISASGSSSTWTDRGSSVGGTAAGLGAALDTISGNGGLSSQIAALGNLSGSTQDRALKQLAATGLTAGIVSTGATVTPSNIAIDTHLNATVADASGLRGKAAGDALQKGAVWGQVLGNHASLQSSSAGDGFTSSAFGILVGVDAFVADDAAAGLAFNWLRNTAKGKDDASGNSTVTDTYQLSLYGSWRPAGQPAWVQGLVAVGLNQYDQQRDIDYLGESATADYWGLQAQAKLSAGYDVAVDGGLTVTPLGSLLLMRTHNRAYSEIGSSVNQAVESQDINTVESIVGARLTKTVDTGLGALTAEVQVGWLHDFISSPISTVATLAGVGYAVDTARLPRDGAQLGIAATLQQSDDLALRLEYQGDLRDGYASHTALLKARQSF